MTKLKNIKGKNEPKYVSEEFQQIENQNKPNLEETEIVNLDDEECVGEVKISVHMTEA